MMNNWFTARTQSASFSGLVVPQSRGGMIASEPSVTDPT